MSRARTPEENKLRRKNYDPMKKRAYYRRNSKRIRAATAETRARRRYGISAAEATDIRREPCGLCGRPGPSHVDHSHATGKVRGPLCFHCNSGLGKFNDDPALLRAAAEYVESHL